MPFLIQPDSHIREPVGIFRQRLSTSSHLTPLREAEADPTRVAPLKAEQGLLGDIFRNNLAHGRVSDFLEPGRVSRIERRLWQRECEYVLRLAAERDWKFDEALAYAQRRLRPFEPIRAPIIARHDNVVQLDAYRRAS